MSNDSNMSGVSRRDLLCAGGATMFSSLVTGLLGGVKPARAQALSGATPEVERLAVRVVTDSYHLAIAPNLKVGGVEVQRFGMPPAGKSLHGEFGLAIHLESTRGNETRNMLLDFGFTSETLNNNLSMLGITPASLDALILSHGHFDHFGGLIGFLQQHRGTLRAALPLYLGGEECFCTREWTIGTPQNFGSLDRKALAEAQIKVVFADMPSVVAGHAFTTGQIALATFEKVLAPTRMTVGTQDGIGCFPDKLPEAKRTARVVPDDFAHRALYLLQRQGARPGGAHVVRPPRRGELCQTGDRHLRRQKSACSGRRHASGPAQGGVCARDGGSAEGTQPRLRHSHALQRGAVH